MTALKPQAVKLSPDTVEAIKNLSIEVSGVRLETYEQKIQHLVWFYRHYKNNNGQSN